MTGPTIWCLLHLRTHVIAPAAAPLLTNRHVSAYNAPVRRKPGALVPLELAICVSAADRHRHGAPEFHGYEIARHLADVADRRLLTAYGTLYRALGRLEKMGMLVSRREDPEIAARANRPGRRLYRLTAEGDAAAREARKAAVAHTSKRARRRLVPARQT
jgi:DNA-binding PadR family transcriptional regulator